MNYLSVCSGIEAATCAWHGLGWNPVGFSEIEKFPSEVLKHHYPHVPNLGDMTKFKEWNFGTNINVFVGGTPCQSFSVAGLRKGLDDPRGNLMLTYLAIANRFRPKWLVWENVPGVLSSNDGKDFGTFLGGLGELGYGFAYRVLDAQYFGVAQRRRRVFVIGHLGDWRPAAAVLFERYSLQRNPAPSRKTGQRTAAFFESSLAQYRAADVGGTLKASGGVLGGGSETFLAQRFAGGVDVTGPLVARDYRGPETDGLNRESAKIIPVVYENHASDSRVKEMGEVCQTVTSTWGSGGGNVPFVGMKAYTLQGGGATSQNSRGMGWNENISFTLNSTDIHGVAIAQNKNFVAHSIGVLGGEHPNAAVAEDFTPTLTSAMGTGGGHIPVVEVDCYPISTQNALGRVNGRDDWPLGLFAEGEPAPTLTKAHGHAVALAYNFAPGKGDLKDDIHVTQAETTKTLDASGSNPAMHQGGVGVVQPKVFSFDSVESNSMKSSNPDSGCREVDLSKTLDTTQPNPAKGQGGIGIMQPISFDLAQITSKVNGTRVDSNLPVSTLAKGSHMHVAYPIAFNVIDDGQDATNGLSPTLRVGGNAGGMMGVAFDTYNQTLSDVNQTIKSPVGGANESIGTVIAPALTTNNPSRSPQASEVTQQVNAVYQASMAVRRLTPIECERLQGFPDNYTNIKTNCPDGPRYKALGNSMAVPVMQWIGQRISDYENNVIGKK
jgi:DNA (cytosine-5)-methyltransferase 1